MNAFKTFKTSKLAAKMFYCKTNQTLFLVFTTSVCVLLIFQRGFQTTELIIDFYIFRLNRDQIKSKTGSSCF